VSWFGVCYDATPVGKSTNLIECYQLSCKLTYMKIKKGNNMTITIVDPLKIADTILDSGYTFQQELLFQALKREVTTGMLMTNPRVTGFPSFAKAVLNFLQDKKAPKTKKNLYNYLVKQGVYDRISWGKK
jgi:hypothetical protein